MDNKIVVLCSSPRCHNILQDIISSIILLNYNGGSNVDQMQTAYNNIDTFSYAQGVGLCIIFLLLVRTILLLLFILAKPDGGGCCHLISQTAFTFCDDLGTI